MIGMKFEGGQELASGLRQLSQRVSRSIQYKALRAGAAPVQQSAKASAPYQPGSPDLRENIGVSIARSRDGDAALAVGPTKGFAYGLPQEIGTSKMPAHPFMRPAFDTQQGAALSAVNLVLRGELIRRDVLGSARTVPQGTSEADVLPEAPSVIGGPGGGLL